MLPSAFRQASRAVKRKLKEPKIESLDNKSNLSPAAERVRKALDKTLKKNRKDVGKFQRFLDRGLPDDVSVYTRCTVCHPLTWMTGGCPGTARSNKPPLASTESDQPSFRPFFSRWHFRQLIVSLLFYCILTQRWRGPVRYGAASAKSDMDLIILVSFIRLHYEAFSN